MKQKESHTGFRNGDLFCFNCGQSYHMTLPQPITMAAALMKQFDKDHKDCVKTWTEPVNDPNGKTETENANWWAVNGEQGISSKVMFNHLSGSLQVRSLRLDFYDRNQTPSDPDDFRRCYLLLKAVPQWKEKLPLLKTLSPTWEKLVENWDKLTELLEEQMATKKGNDMYKLMKSIGC